MRKMLSLFCIIFLLSGCDMFKKCPEGFEEEGEMCLKVDQVFGEKVKVPFCVIGVLINGNCYESGSNLSKTPNISYYGKYYCNYGYTLIGNRCVPISTPPMYEEKIVCPDGYYENTLGVPGGLDVPKLNPPGAPVYCYKRIIVEKE